ncbi:glycosyltransferase [Mucilaginibacter sp. RS28]|uniref:Glycosyltransferase n=1 Tax=Mucilaginibacter straminoryzae TaxID=2932774 RepID=A0A9X2BA18_9SPHI|nr:glycosyltransferase family 2 protein [Mucilaginibacter straminoryzae]MCJ8210330.1 glycosyltransferase [Mucilaginibacter straminoryzae]
MTKSALVSVIMPVYNQAHFIKRAIESLKLQQLQSWELIIINDGSKDDLERFIRPYLNNHRIRYFFNQSNEGLGACLNKGLDLAHGHFIAYLPADDVYYAGHLKELLAGFNEHTALVYSGVKHHYNRIAGGQIAGYSLQLVQVMHRKSGVRWIERDELVTDDLGRMYWDKIQFEGDFVNTGNITCEWVDHPHQRHKIIREPIGGINPYKLYYGVKQPLRYHSTMGNFIDEVSYFKQFRERKDTPAAKSGLKILLVGELAYNSERVLALEEQGQQLYGLWMKDPYWYNSVGPLPFGHVEDIAYEDRKKRIAEIQPDIIYAQLNWQAVPFAHQILMENPDVPFVWHFKEGPFICLEKGTWKELLDLHNLSDGQIYTSPEMRDWFLQFVSGSDDTTLIMDGDLPKKEWFKTERQSRISYTDGDIHTVVPGRPIGLHPHTVAELAEHKIHLHFYGDFTHGQWMEWITKTQKMALGFLHIHANVTQENWVKEFSQYDAGWLHFFQSENNGELMRANWDDLNYPARMATLGIAGLPMLQRDNTGHIVATQNLIQRHDLGVFFKDMADLSKQLHDKERMQQLRDNVWSKRMMFCFDEQVKMLTSFFRQVISLKASGKRKEDLVESHKAIGY